MPYYERNLPHWLPEGKNLFVTWRLYGSLPAVIVATLRKTDDLKDGKRFRFIDRELDGAAFGPVWLRDPRMAKIVVAAMDAVAHAGLCLLHAFVVMPNHVHPLLEPKVDWKRITPGKAGQPEPVTWRSSGPARDSGRKNHATTGYAIPHGSRR
jgi:hypothetical protein